MARPLNDSPPGALSNPVLVEVVRGTTTESRHAGALAIVDGDGRLHTTLGDIDRPIFPRSAVKLLQALPLVASGAADALGLSDDELALACASHNGEAEHAATAASMLAKAGLDASALECGVHWPYLDTAQRELARRGETPSALHNNCSGKHAGFLCLACHHATARGLDLRQYAAGYVDAGHEVMREITAAIGQASGNDLAQAPSGTDGCSIPTYAMPLRSLALAYARVATGQGLSEAHARAALRLRQAIAAAPFMVAGSGRFDTRVMQQLGAAACIKVGAEGVYCAALPGLGLGVAIKMDDGNNARAVEVVMASVLAALLPVDAAFVDVFCRPALHNWNGILVGRLQPAAALHAALKH